MQVIIHDSLYLKDLEDMESHVVCTSFKALLHEEVAEQNSSMYLCKIFGAMNWGRHD